MVYFGHSEEPMQTLNSLKWLLELSIGLAVFIGGLFIMRFGLRTVATRHAEHMLAALVKTPWRGLLTGIGATLITQSSAAVTILSMGLVASGVLRFSETIGIILGTNIGSTLTVGLLTLNLERFGPWVVGVGVTAYLMHAVFTHVRKTRRMWRATAVSLIGFGILFTGFGIISHAVQPFATSPAMLHYLTAAQGHPWTGLLAGTLITALIGSSSATTAVTITLAKTGSLPLISAIAVVFGNNIGTCTTALLASIGGSRDVQRVAATHVLLNVAGAIVFMLFLQPFTDLVRQSTDNPAQQVAVAHILFNVLSSLIALPFASKIARILVRILP